jgi:hypothetical protein
MNAQLSMLKGKKSASTLSTKKSKELAAHLENIQWVTEETITEDTVVLEPDITHSFQCEHCSTRDERIWRNGPSGPATLCNRCGVVYANAQLASSSSARKKRKAKVFGEDMKQELTTFISAMSGDPDFMEKILNIVVKGMPHLKNIQQEMELDLNQVPSPVLWKLWAFCKKVAGETGAIWLLCICLLLFAGGVILEQQSVNAGGQSDSDAESSD